MLTIKQQKQAHEKKRLTGDAPNFPALHLLYDPQTFAEKLYDILNNHDKRFSLDHKILIMHLLARVMGVHKLCVLGFYTYIVKYLTYKQLRVPAILVSLAQSVHELTPPDVLIPVIRKIAQEFIHPGVASEVISAGLNSVREVCRRQPWAMEEDLLGDLVEYRKSRDKGVTAAARGLLRLYREVNPAMLKRRERVRIQSFFSYHVAYLWLYYRVKMHQWACQVVFNLCHMVIQQKQWRALKGLTYVFGRHPTIRFVN